MTVALQQQHREAAAFPKAVPGSSMEHPEGLLPMLGAAVGAMAISSVPLFSGSPMLSLIPQMLAVLAVGAALILLSRGLPRFHAAIIAHSVLVAFWAISLMENPGAWTEYQTLLKVTVMGLAAHVIFRSPRQIALLFAIYTTTGLAAVALNWTELQRLATAGVSTLSEQDRFAGTFANANSAGIYGVMLILSSIVTLLCLPHRVRWVLAPAGILAGLTIFFFSGSRKGMLGLAFILALLPWLATRGTKSTGLSIARGIGVGILVLGSVVALSTSLPFVDRLIVPFTQGVAAESSSEHRMAMFTRAVELWLQHPLLGCGFDGFARLSEFGVYSHSTFSEVLCNAGMLGLAFLAVFYGVPAWNLVTLSRRRNSDGTASKDILPLCLLAFWGVFGIFSMFAVLFDSREFIPMSAAVCGYIAAQQGDPNLRPGGGA